MHINSQIIPTILVDKKENFLAAVKTIGNFTNHIQLDITDGEFTSHPTINLTEIELPQGWQVDLHLMVRRPSEFLPEIFRLKPSMVIFHAEANEDLEPIFKKLKDQGFKVGLALLKPTVPDSVKNLISLVDHVMIFAGSLGQMGGEASLIQLEKIRLIKKINDKVEIGWDGGANIDNVFMLSRGGVDYINVGSALAYANDPAAVFAKMQKEIAKQSVV